jgi:hypothetical protein
MARSTEASEPAGERFRSAAQFATEDAELLHFRYHLRRLTVVGLTDHDVEDLHELGRLAFQGSDVAKQVANITGRKDASPLAVALAEIVGEGARSASGADSIRSLAFGAVLGAYAALGEPDTGDRDAQRAAAVIGAIGGAVATTTATMVTGALLQRSWSSYLSPDG